ncbi:hypothetical protein BTO06_07155 [Tenacibaculum sp. SZ-18]|uniref:hypothetical protein n=1 Tax=Tenacibaculum sp. SZ-18 TaxID=754423 RepID=UPI000C2D07D6|nr:hypothetical protein [Tenacibaculum sp. SZ-18]AUC14928.1 hypothetical protein BTO06_07155 [Tenacibaculum sp. SZ-18]
MKKLIFTILIVLFLFEVKGQSLSQDSEGYSTIILPSTNFNLDVADKKANFNISSYLNKKGEKLKSTQAGWLIGGEINAEVENEIGSLFSGGDIASNAEINILFGRKWFGENVPELGEKLKKLRKGRKNLQNEIALFNDRYDAFLKDLLDNNKIDFKLSKMVQFYVSTTDENREILDKKLDSIQKGIANGTILDREISNDSYDKIKKYNIKEHQNNIKKNRVISDSINVLEKTYRFSFKKLFIRSGISGTNFRYDLGQDSTTVDSRFEKRNFEGWNLEVGYNIQYMQDHFFGWSYEIRKTNNLSDLKEREYTLTKVDPTVTDGTFSNSTNVKAFSGTFDSFNRHSLNFDYIWVTPIKKDDKNSNTFLSLNPYFRHRIYDNSLKFRNNTVLGIALNVFNSEKQKIMGGISIQTNDLFGVHAKDESVLGDRISIGLVAKFSFSGIKLDDK